MVVCQFLCLRARYLVLYRKKRYMWAWEFQNYLWNFKSISCWEWSVAAHNFINARIAVVRSSEPDADMQRAVSQSIWFLWFQRKRYEVETALAAYRSLSGIKELTNEAMADSLDESWKDLNSQLETRRILLDTSVAFHESADEVSTVLTLKQYPGNSELWTAQLYAGTCCYIPTKFAWESTSPISKCYNSASVKFAKSRYF